MMGKLDDLFGMVKKKFGKKEDSFDDGFDDIDEKSGKEMDINTPDGNKSMRRGEHGQILGLDRKIVTGIAVFFVGVFCLAFIYASTKGPDPKQQPEKTLSQADIAGSEAINKSNNTKKLNDDYGELERANRAKMNGGNPVGNTGTAANNTTQQNREQKPASETVVAQPTNPQTLPAVPRTNVVATPPGYAQNYSLPSQQASGQSAEDKEEAERKKSFIERAKDRLSSAIAFATGSEKSMAQSGSGQGAAAGSNAGTSSNGQQGTKSSGASMQVTNTKPTYVAPTPNTITAGTIIPAMLVTGINSDSPGQVYAQIMADVYDIYGQNILIPAGSRVLGTVSGGGKGDTGRVGVTFNQLVLPNGGAWNIGDSFVAMDGAGYTGLRGKVHKHTGSNFMKGVFNSAITALSTVAVDRVTIDASALTAMTQSQQPTTTVEPGYTFSIYVTQNIQF